MRCTQIISRLSGRPCPMHNISSGRALPTSSFRHDMIHPGSYYLSFSAGIMSLALWRQTPPVLRAAVISGTVMSAADVVCQRVQHRGSHKFKVDWHRTARFGIIGCTLHGPFFFLGFGALDHKFGPAANLKTAFIKTMTGQVTLFPTYLTSFFLLMGALEGKGLEGGVDKIRDSFGQTFIKGSVFWPIANLINFRFVPTTHRVLYVNLCGLIWNTYLSWVNSRQQEEVAAASLLTPVVAAQAAAK